MVVVVKWVMGQEAAKAVVLVNMGLEVVVQGTGGRLGSIRQRLLPATIEVLGG